MWEIDQVLADAKEKGVSDIFVVAGYPLAFKIEGLIEPQNDTRLMPNDTQALVEGFYEKANRRDMTRLLERGDDDFSFSISGLGRFRINAFKQRASLACVIRFVRFDLPDPEALNIPPGVIKLAERGSGIILVTGPAGSGKSTTLALMIDSINRSRNNHIITIEDPVEFIHRHNRSIVTQREIATDTESYADALRASLRQAPDVILVGEMRDFETINVAMTAAETGHLILSTLHTVGAAHTVDRIVDVFPPEQQHQIRLQLSMVLSAVVSQQLIPRIGGGLVPAYEVMTVNPAVRNMIREAKMHQLETVLQSSADEGMISMDNSLIKLYQSNLITLEDARKYAINPDQLERRIRK